MTGISLAAVLIEMIGISFVLPVSECDLTLTSSDKGVLSGIGFVGKVTIELKKVKAQNNKICHSS